MALKIIYTETLFPSIDDFAILKNVKGVVVCPNPQMADGVRRLLEQELVSELDVITISKATSELKDRLGIEGVALRKADILMHFATLWKSVHGTDQFEMFNQSYQLFSEFRSFTTNFELITEALGALGKEQQAALTLYWRYLEQGQIMDEHTLYEKIATTSLELEEPEDSPIWENIVFWGFPHLSGTQVNLVKSLAHISQVKVFFPTPLIRHVHSHDFIAWLDPDIEAHRKKALEIKPQEQKDLRVIRFAKKRLASALGSQIRSSELLGKEILIGAKRPDFNLFQEMPFSSLTFKTPSDGLESLAAGLVKSLRYEQSTGATDYRKYTAFLDQSLKKSHEEQDFRLMRVIFQYKKMFEQYVDLSSLNEEINSFDLKLFEEIFASTLPRMFTSLLSEEGELPINVQALDSLSSEEKNNVGLMVIASHYGPLKQRESYYPDEVADFLAVVGPVKRSDFDFQLLKLRLQTLLDMNRPILAIEGHMEKEDPAWSEVLADFNLIEIAHVSSQESKEIKDFNVKEPAPYTRTLSASSLQLYLDCPRKFYVSKIAKLDDSRPLSVEVAPNELGSLEHALIGALYFKKRDGSFIREEVKKAFADFIKDRAKSISSIMERGYLFEIEQAVFNGLQLLDQLANELRVNEVRFDVKLKEKAGEADCILVWGEGESARWGLLDFKRSKSSVARKSEVENLKKIQLPFYLHNIGLNSSNCAFIGYVNLSDLKDSTLVRLDSSFTSEVKFEAFSMAPGEFLETSKNFLNDTEIRLRKDSSFLAEPLSPAVCTFCIIKNICLKSSVEESDENS